MDFITLPVELRLSILEIVADSSTGRTTEYATVSREWQPVFEKKHFQRIILSSQCLKNFAQIVRGPKRKLVKHIWLRTELDAKRHDGGNAGFRPTMSLVDVTEFVNTIERLFRILSTWERPQDLNKEGLTLEMSPWSLYDDENSFGHRRLVHDSYSKFDKDYRINPRISHSLITPVMLNHNLPRFSDGLVMEVGGTTTEDIPKVDIVTTLLLHRQYSLISSERIAQIFGSLAKLEQIIYESPERIGNVIDIWQEKRYWFLSDYYLPQTLKQLTIFEDPFHRNAITTSYQTGTAKNPVIAMTLFKESRNLEHLSLSFIVDTKEFFQPFWPSAPANKNQSWDKLKTIALTSHLLNPYQSPEEVNDLLYAAGVAARNMPALRVMEIWNGFRTAHGCLFRYYDDGSTSTITWRGTWDLELEPRVMECWTETVRRNTCYLNVGFCDMELPVDGTSFPASILRHLKLKDHVIHPASFRQLQLLGEPRRHK